MSHLRSAAEIVKGDIKVMTLSETDVMQRLDHEALLDGLADGFRAVARGEIQAPGRPEIRVPGKGFLLAMSAWREGSSMMVKTVCVFEENLQRNLPNHLAMINLFDPITGQPLCVMDGTYITGIRTAAAAALSVRELSRRDSKVVTVVGAGVQGREHLSLLPLVRDFDEIMISSLRFGDAQVLARLIPGVKAVEDLEAAVRRSDVVCLASHAYQPIIEPEWVQPGTHVTSVGYAPPLGELPVALARDHTLYVEDDASFEPPPVGCGELQDIDRGSAIRLGDALIGRASLRTAEDEITVYKAMGIAMEDLVAAELVYRSALSDGVSTAAIL
ncbi:ornithine cyclodeaminase family protein [Denitrobaculum tricleocarpae]|uniref:Ornithine cyclodeaminase family protein n=2 Tax=Denitrobaculum tricleocarpae TaxID=2591009 RepID=A0A545U363_9PROT|nr:ornithine cyclodeaminase family protein [Denitrobaculum tricleocarpae]